MTSSVTYLPSSVRALKQLLDELGADSLAAHIRDEVKLPQMHMVDEVSDLNRAEFALSPTQMILRRAPAYIPAGTWTRSGPGSIDRSSTNAFPRLRDKGEGEQRSNRRALPAAAGIRCSNFGLQAVVPLPERSLARHLGYFPPS